MAHRGPRAVPWLVALGLGWALLSHVLAAQGAAARGVLVPIAPERYYAAERWFVAPWLFFLGALFVGLARGLSGVLGGRATCGALFAELVPVWAGATLALFVLPDLVVASTLGHAQLAVWMRFYAPLAPLVIVAAGSARLARAAEVGRGRAVLAVTLALVGQTLVAALLLR